MGGTGWDETGQDRKGQKRTGSQDRTGPDTHSYHPQLQSYFSILTVSPDDEGSVEHTAKLGPIELEYIAPARERIDIY
jgi:hypothetical protein